jgi:hypothetical protein
MPSCLSQDQQRIASSRRCARICVWLGVAAVLLSPLIGLVLAFDAAGRTNKFEQIQSEVGHTAALPKYRAYILRGTVVFGVLEAVGGLVVTTSGLIWSAWIKVRHQSAEPVMINTEQAAPSDGEKPPN